MEKIKFRLVIIFVIILPIITTAHIIPQGLTIKKIGNSYNIEFELPDLYFDTITVTKQDRTTETFFDININDDFGIIDSIGLPQIPQLTFAFAIPYNSNKPSFSINNIQTEELTLSNKIYPFQQPWTTDRKLSEREFFINQSYYLSTEMNFNPVVISAPYIIAGTKGVDIRINPIVYNPLQNKLILRKKISFTININQSYFEKTISSLSLDGFLSSLFVNYTPKSNKSITYGNYLIITPPEYQEMINRFANYKANIGYTVTVVNTNTTGTTKEQIKNYIHSQYDTPSTRPVFVLLVGDVDKIPNWIGSHSDHPPTDLNYSLLEGSDNEADVFLGRFSINTKEELENIIDKTIYMETNVQNWNKKVVFSADFDCMGYFRGGHNSVKSVFDNKGYNCNKIYQDKDKKCFLWIYVPVSNSNVGTTADLHTAINNNITFLIYSGHGSEYEIVDPRISISDITSNTFTNLLFPFTFAFACYTNRYTYSECVGEAWLRHENCGVTYYGASIPTYYGTDEKLEKKIFNKGFGNANKEQIGPMIVYGMKKVLHSIASGSRKLRYVQMYNLLGDPSINTSGIDASCFENYVFYNSVSYGSGENLTFRANNTIITGEGNSTFTVTGNSNVKLIAGNRIELKSGTYIAPGSGGYFEASIAPCNSSKSSEVNTNNSYYNLNKNEKINNGIQKNNDFEIIAYPNPFTEKCNIEYSLQNETNITIEVYNLLGEKVFIKNLNNQAVGKNIIILTNKELNQKGIYIVKIQTDNQEKTLFILKQ